MAVACEKMVRYVLPWIRKEFAKIMVNELGLSQVEVAKKLEVTEPAISQYLSSKRGNEIEINNEKILLAVREAALLIVNENSANLGREICKICRLIRVSNAIPNVYRQKIGAEEFDECICDTFE